MIVTLFATVCALNVMIVFYEDVITNASGRERHPVGNTWGALHDYHN